MTSMLYKLMCQAWFISGAHCTASLQRMAEQMEVPEDIGRRPERDAYGEEMPRMRLFEGVAVVPIHGPIIKGASGLEKWWLSGTSHEDIAEDIDAAMDAGVQAVVFNVDSPGGTVSGTPELAEKIANLPVPTSSYSDTLQASAAEYLTAGVDNRFGSASGTFGSIGTIMTSVSFAGLAERIGIQFNVIKSGAMKGAGHPMSRLTDEQRAHFQETVDMMAGEFKDHMAAYRPNFDRRHMDGRTFTGKQAEEIGLIDARAGSVLEVVDYAKGLLRDE